PSSRTRTLLRTSPTRSSSDLFARSSNALVVEVSAVGHFGTHGDALFEGGLQTDAELGGEVAVLALTRTVGVQRCVLFFRLLVAQDRKSTRLNSSHVKN